MSDHCPENELELNPNQVRRQIEEYLEWRPPNLADAPGSSFSPNTRPPAYWDMHLSEELILKQVVRLPSLLETLGGIVGDVLAKLRDDGTLDDLFRATNLSNIRSPKMSRYVRDEAGVVAYYQSTTARISSVLASAFELRLPNWNPIFEWTISPGIAANTASQASKSSKKLNNGKRPRGPRNTTLFKTAKKPKIGLEAPTTSKAVADGFLRFVVEKEFQKRVASLPADKQKELEAIRSHFTNLLIWEFKSLTAGSEETMEAIGVLAGKEFPWTTCSKAHKCSNASHLELDGMLKVTMVRTGPDSTETPWTFPAFSDEPAGGASVDLKDSEDDTPTALAGLEDGAKLGEGVAPTIGKSKKRKNVKPKASPKGTLAPEVKARYIVQQVYFVIYGSGTLTHSLHLQAWAEAVQGDITLFVIQSGNLEYICVRHRASQTLYLSELLPIPKSAIPCTCDGTQRLDPPYIKLHTGLYIAALRDAKNRASQISAYKDKNDLFPYIGDPTRVSAPLPHTAFTRPEQVCS